MAKKISQLTQATEVKSDDVTVIVQDGETKKIPLNMMVTKQDIENKKIAGLAKLDEIEATYENDTYTPTITVKNKSSVKVGEGDEVDYSANVMDGHVKSAILKGQTLVNISDRKGIYELTPNKAVDSISNLYKNSTTYTIIFNAITNGIEKIRIQEYLVYDFSGSSKDYPIKDGLNMFTYTTSVSNVFNNIKLRHFDTTTDKNLILSDLMIIEGNHIDKDIPYFEGIQSVKMPVLKTTGKNLFDGEYENGGIHAETGNNYNADRTNRSINFIKVKPSTQYYLTKTTESRIFEYDKNKQYLQWQYGGSKTLSEKTEYIRISWVKTGSDNLIQLEEGSVATSYEPYKSNILTVNEPVELRGIGDVQDTLNCLTGEVVERIGEIELVNREWIKNESFLNPVYGTTIDNLFFDKDGNSMCDKLSRIPYDNRFNIEVGQYYTTADRIYVGHNNMSVSEFKSYIDKLSPKLQYQLKTPVVKTVDLIPSGTHPSTTPYCWKDGHIQLSSSGLLPSLEYSVVTSRAGQISQNAAMIAKNDKRIFDLEILLAGGLVNTTYQALTLQNQVETGLSKVSLSSETEPDYLLYHMIMKLIEEKAYKLDDLAEKVSVFYLYEKLSDEQFETIYSELYPFVEEEYIELPEDGEIIEEPIVDEVLEEVENGVVM